MFHNSKNISKTLKRKIIQAVTQHLKFNINYYTYY